MGLPRAVGYSKKSPGQHPNPLFVRTSTSKLFPIQGYNSTCKYVGMRSLIWYVFSKKNIVQQFRDYICYKNMSPIKKLSQCSPNEIKKKYFLMTHNLLKWCSSSYPRTDWTLIRTSNVHSDKKKLEVKWIPPQSLASMYKNIRETTLM